MFPARANSGMIYFTRTSDMEQIDVCINTGKRNRTIRSKYFSDDTHFKVVDLLTGKEYSEKNNKVNITIPPGTAMVLKQYQTPVGD